MLSSLGPDFGYFSNAFKAVLIVKPDLLSIVTAIFAGADVQITGQGQHHLGTLLPGSWDFAEEYVTKRSILDPMN